MMARPSLYEFAGGDEAFVALATAHHARCLADPVLNHPFSHPGHPQHVERLATYWAEVLGGPPRFSSECNGESDVVALHAGIDGTDDLPTRFFDCFVAAIDDAGLPDDPDFRAALRGYMHWATQNVHSYSPAGSVVPEQLSIPHWSWDGLQAV
jgi:hemoglobin